MFSIPICLHRILSFILLLSLAHFLYWGAFGAPILFSEIGFCVASCSYIYIIMYIYISVKMAGFVDFTMLSFALSSLAQPFDQVGSIPDYVFVILSQRKAYAGRFRKETAGKRTRPMTKWPPRRLLITRLEIIFVTISFFAKSCSQTVSRRRMLLRGFNKSCLRVTALNATEAERPFYERSLMVLHVPRRLLLQLLASM